MTAENRRKIRQSFRFSHVKINRSFKSHGKKTKGGVFVGAIKTTLPGKDTLAYRFLELTAICGEFPADLLPRFPGSASYQETVISSLKKSRLLKTYYRDRLRGYRLGTRAKALLLESNPERFSFYLTGNAETNLLKSEVTRRLRLHRIAEIYVCMMNAGVSVFRDEKPDVFAPDPQSLSPSREAAFYNSREIKEVGIEAVKIRGSRMMGALLAPTGIFLTYNVGSQLHKWEYRAEYRAKVLLQIILCQQRMVSQYAGCSACGLLYGDNLDPFYQIFASADSGTRCFFLLDGNYDHFYYFTNDHYGEVLTKLLCDPDRTSALNGVLSQGLYAKDPGQPFEHDALDEQGNPVLFGYFLDIPRIQRFFTALNLQDRPGTLICFDFQEEMLRRLCNENIHLQTISFEKFERRFYP